MNKNSAKICEKTVKNYRYNLDNLRYDGDYINHFSALLYGYYNKEIPDTEVKEIRGYIKHKTSKMSVFRGNMLYILSFLIALDTENKEKMCDDILEVFEMLLERGFAESTQTALAAFSVVKYKKENAWEETVKKAGRIFNLMKKKFSSVTKEDDYLICTLLAIDDISLEKLNENLEKVYEYIQSFKKLSNNESQYLANSMFLNKKDISTEAAELIKILNDSKMEVDNEFLGLFGVIDYSKSPEYVITSMKEIIQYLCEEESEYNFFIDRGFRNMIAFVICYKGIGNIRYMDELLAFGTYQFISSKNQGILNEVLA